MSGIYIHIPFCKQACHYCDFHFSTTTGNKDLMIQAICKELFLRKSEIPNEPIETIYFGGGTPSLLTAKDITELLNVIGDHYQIIAEPEVTLEANPDDLDEGKISELSDVGINRLSIGIQSFNDEDLRLMNRAHDSAQAHRCLEEVRKYFENISVDLIYGIPGMGNSRWNKNIETVLKYKIPHISAYALTVEPRTALKSFIVKGLVDDVDEEQAEQHYIVLQQVLSRAGFVHYEISNFGMPGFFSANNTAYWRGNTYLGFGPSAHSYDGLRRSWNVRNNPKYIRALNEGLLPAESELLSKNDRFNEYVMTGLRTIWGVSLDKLREDFGPQYPDFLMEQAQVFMDDKLLYLEEGVLRATKKGKFLIDGIASHLFMLNLEN